MKKVCIAAAAAALATAAEAQQSAAPAAPTAYGAPVTLDQAKRIVAAAEQAARGRGFNMAFAVVEPSGALVLFHRMDGTQYGSVAVAQEKARTSALFRRPTKAFEDAVGGGRMAVLGLPGVVPIEGGVPIVVGGRIAGAIGVSGGSSAQDGEIAAAGLAALK